MIHFLVPGPLSTQTGGYIYDRLIVEELKARGWELSVHPISAPKSANLGNGWAQGHVLIDGLLLPDLRFSCSRDWERAIGLIHHPRYLEACGQSQTLMEERERAAFRRLRGIICTSEHTATLIHGMGVASDRIRVVYPGVQDPRRDAVVSDGVVHVESREIADDGSGVPSLLCVATLTRRKGHDLLLDALERVAIDCDLHLVGSDEFEPYWAQRIRRRIERWSAPGRIHVHGELSNEDKRALLLACDLFVLPSRYEGFGMAAMEAIQLGVPVLTTRVGGLPEAVRFGGAVLVDPEAGAFAAGMLECIEPGRRLDLQRQARSAALRYPTWRECGGAFEAALMDLGWGVR